LGRRNIAFLRPATLNLPGHYRTILSVHHINPTDYLMKHILTALTVIALASSSALAGCGKTDTAKGTLKSFDKATKQLVVEADGKEVKLTLTPSTKGGDKVEGLVGKKVTVVSSHKKAESVEG
jgi:predicted small lipoprotein YifL